jgi:Cft2 family RNA processing exonuclease
MGLEIVHHGAVGGVTGSCHELRTGHGDAILIDCGLFQDAETSATSIRRYCIRQSSPGAATYS